jgi:hypothetical protein
VTLPTRYELGRALAAGHAAKLGSSGTPEADDMTADIEAAGGWDPEVERGYFEAYREYLRGRSG